MLLNYISSLTPRKDGHLASPPEPVNMQIVEHSVSTEVVVIIGGVNDRILNVKTIRHVSRCYHFVEAAVHGVTVVAAAVVAV